jgi:hypothetical protein
MRKEMNEKQEYEEEKLATFNIPHILYCNAHIAS